MEIQIIAEEIILHGKAIISANSNTSNLQLLIVENSWPKIFMTVTWPLFVLLTPLGEFMFLCLVMPKWLDVIINNYYSQLNLVRWCADVHYSILV